MRYRKGREGVIMATKKKAAPKKKVAVKKATAKKAVVKKAALKKKAAVKKAPARKPAPPKKAVAKKPPVKKVAPKKKAPVKKSAVKKSSAKKASAKRPVTKKVAVRSTASVSTSPVALLERPRPTFTSTTVVETKPVINREPVLAPEPEKKKKSPIGYFLAFGAVVLIATAVASNSDSSNESAKPTPQVSASESVSEDPVAPVELGAPLDVFADYTPTGGKVTWKAPTTADQVTGYLVQSSYRGGAFKTIATLETSALSHEVMKIDTPGFTTFRVVAVYGDQEVASDISELKGQYEG